MKKWKTALTVLAIIALAGGVSLAQSYDSVDDDPTGTIGAMLSVVAPDLASLDLYVDGVKKESITDFTGVQDGDTLYFKETTFPEGPTRIYVEAVDFVGNEARSRVHVHYVDWTPPLAPDVVVVPD